MSHPELMIPQTLLDELNNCSQSQFSGKLNITNSKGNKWTFYYRLGRIVWGTGATHPLRRWRRYMTQHCTQINLDHLQISANDLEIDYWDYHLLTVLHKQEQIKREQINAIAEHIITELLFDLAQQSISTPLVCDRDANIIISTPTSLNKTDLFVQQMQDSWSKWYEAGLASVSPNLAPIVSNTEQLQQHVSPTVYKNFIALLNGKFTLRSLALKLKQDILPLTKSLLPYVNKGIIELVEIPDLSLTPSPTTSPAVTTESSRTPLIACIDDSIQTCQMLEEIFTSRGLQYMHVHDSIQALPLLLERKPDLIFLDLVMPVANGYEICAQLRRMSAFIHTPVIILTGSDGLVDRVRAKVVGATDFLSKPVAVDKVIAMVRKHLQTSSVSAVSSAESSAMPSMSSSNLLSPVQALGKN